MLFEITNHNYCCRTFAFMRECLSVSCLSVCLHMCLSGNQGTKCDARHNNLRKGSTWRGSISMLNWGLFHNLVKAVFV